MQKLSEVNTKLKGKLSKRNKFIQLKQIESTCLHYRFKFQFGVKILINKFGAKNSHPKKLFDIS